MDPSHFNHTVATTIITYKHAAGKVKHNAVSVQWGEKVICRWPCGYTSVKERLVTRTTTASSCDIKM